MIKTICLFLLPLALFGQASPTEASYLATQFGSGAVDNTADGQFPKIRRGLVGLNFNPPTIGGHNLLMSVGYTGATMTSTVINSFTDTLRLSGMTWMEVNADADFFTTSGSAAVLYSTFTGADQKTRYDATFLYAVTAASVGSPAVSVPAMSVKINVSYGVGNAKGNFTTHSCADVPGNCTGGYFTDFAHFQTAGINAIVAMATRWGAPAILGAKFKGLNFAHEPQPLANSNLFASGNRWVNTSCTATDVSVAGCAGSPKEWNDFATAAAAAVRAIGAGSCSTCSTTLKLSMTTLGGASDSTDYFPVFAGNTSLDEVCIDPYTPNAANLNAYLGTTVATNIVAVAKAAGKQTCIQEWNPVNWVPNNAPTGESVAYKGRGNNDWNTSNHDIQNYRTVYLYAGKHGFNRMPIFQTLPLAYYCTGTVCGLAGCGDNGIQCADDIPTQNPFINNCIAAIQAAITAGSPPLQTSFSKAVKQISTASVIGAF